MKLRKTAWALRILAIAAMGTIAWQSASAQSDSTSTPVELLVAITTPDAQTQAMAMVLASEALSRKAPVRILLCGPAGDLAFVNAKEGEIIKPMNKTPAQILQGLLQKGMMVQLCSDYLQNRGKSEQDMLKEVQSTSLSDISSYMNRPSVRYFTF